MSTNPEPERSVIVDDPKKPWKAVASTAGTFVGLFVATWIADVDPFTLKEAAGAALGAGIGAGLIGGVTYRVPNPKAVKRLPVK